MRAREPLVLLLYTLLVWLYPISMEKCHQSNLNVSNEKKTIHIGKCVHIILTWILYRTEFCYQSVKTTPSGSCKDFFRVCVWIDSLCKSFSEKSLQNVNRKQKFYIEQNWMQLEKILETQIILIQIPSKLFWLILHNL